MNPYVQLFYEALHPYGINRYSSFEISSAWGKSNFSRIDAIHLHLPEYIWQEPPKELVVRSAWRKTLHDRVPGAWMLLRVLDKTLLNQCITAWKKTARRWQVLLNFRNFLRQARENDMRVLWTLHNVKSHKHWGFNDKLDFLLLAKSSDPIICHSTRAKEEAKRRYERRCPLVVMQHGNYDGVPPQPRPREVVLGELGLDPSLPVAGYIGALREYKGFDRAAEAVTSLGGFVQLLCAREPISGLPLDKLRKLIGDIPGRVLIAAKLTDQQFADYCSACDTLLLPYRKITGSGALIGALTFGRPVIASDLPYFYELSLGAPSAVRLVPPERPTAIAQALADLVSEERCGRNHAARALADCYAWSEKIRPAAEAMVRMLAVKKTDWLRKGEDVEPSRHGQYFTYSEAERSVLHGLSRIKYFSRRSWRRDKRPTCPSFSSGLVNTPAG